MQELEIEKRFLVKEGQVSAIKSLVVPNSKTIMNDFYIPNGEAHKDLRLRRKGENYMITRKRPTKDGDSTIMMETTLELSAEEFAALSNGVTTSVEKERYLVDVSEWRGELDVFTGRLAGLVILEFEFNNEADLADFEKNAKLELLDITNVKGLAGGSLADTSVEGLQKKLARLEDSKGQ